MISKIKDRETLFVLAELCYLEGAASEKIVHSEHNAHTKAATIAEIRRILHLHLETIDEN